MYGEKKVIDENVEKGMLCAIFLLVVFIKLILFLMKSWNIRKF